MARTADIRNVALVGHRGAGKTSLVEALLHAAGATNRMGTVEAGNTVCDFDEEEQRRTLSIATGAASFEYRGLRINLLDTPGYADFQGDTYGALRVADAALLVVHAEAGVEVETEKAWAYCGEFDLPVLAVISHLDAERAELEEVVAQLHDRLGARTVMLQLPIGHGGSLEGVVDLASGQAYPGGQIGSPQPEQVPADLAAAVEEARNELTEFAAENDESLLDKFIEGQPLTAADIHGGLKLGVADRSVVPVLCAAGTREVGSFPLLEAICGLLPSPAERPAARGVRPGTEQERERPPDVAAPFSALCFKALLGEGRRVMLMRVLSGTLSSGATVLNTTRDDRERLGNLAFVRGEQLTDVSEVVAGDIVGAVKINARTGDTLAASDDPILYPPTVYPEPLMAVAVHPRSRGDEEKIGHGLTQLKDEDPSFRYERNPATGEMVLSGAGDMHIQVLLSKLRNRYKVEVDTTVPKTAYLETFRHRVEAQGRFKKQTGGAGQFGDVHLRVEPLPRGSGFEFDDAIFGGSVPRQYIPSVEKGVRERMGEGFLAGFPLVDVKVSLYDGSYHSVDSSDIAFQLAGRMALETCAEKGGLYLLEPIHDVWITVPEDYVGDIMADLPRRRGTVMGTVGTGGMQTIQAQVPAAEMASYATDLRSMTQGRGTFRTQFARYEEVPTDMAQKVIAAREAEKAEERK